MKVDDVTLHHMHSEFYMVDEEAAQIINETKDSGGRVIAVAPQAPGLWKLWPMTMAMCAPAAAGHRSLSTPLYL